MSADSEVLVKAKTPLEKLEAICAEIYERWDKDQRSGKLLAALAGTTPGYRQDVDDVRQALTDYKAGAPAESFQKRVLAWMMECFSMEVCRDGTERNHRFLEEALELVQSLGCTRSEAHQLVDYTFDRPAGEPKQELGGVMVTLAALCFPHGLDMNEAAETELARVWQKIDVIRAKQAAKPKHSPLPAAAVPSSSIREECARIADSHSIALGGDETADAIAAAIRAADTGVERTAETDDDITLMQRTAQELRENPDRMAVRCSREHYLALARHVHESAPSDPSPPDVKGLVGRREEEIALLTMPTDKEVEAGARAIAGMFWGLPVSVFLNPDLEGSFLPHARAALEAAEKVRETSSVTAENHLGAISNSEKDEGL